ncbi:MAG: zinc-ribbon domain containing protein, partial [Bacteroidota bacterium]
MSKRKQKSDSFYRCPCCGQRRRTSELTKVAEQLKVEESSLGTLRDDSRQGLDWACDPCISQGKTLKANLKRQVFCWYGHLYYYDEKRICQTCHQSFLFTRKEKKFWYEQLQFWIESKPNHCPECRRAIRRKKLDNTRLSELLK